MQERNMSMQPFLQIVATQLLERFNGQLHELAVVFPNRRQAVFFSHYLQQLAAPPCFLPELLTIEELVAKSGSMQVADNLTQGFALYEAYVQIAKEKGDTDIPPFDVFFSIGETILKDFREIDSYLVNVEDICQILYDIESIDKRFDQLTEEQRAFLKSFWKGTIDKGNIQEKFLRLWERLPAIYHVFQQLLTDSYYTTMGRLYRQLATDVSAQQQLATHWSHVAFVGFNAFNKAEETLIKKWNDAGYASCWFDADTWYVQQAHQEAGDFLRRNFEVIGLRNELPLLSSIAQRTLPIQVTATEGQMAQAKQIEHWWQHISQQQQDNKRIGILLADESLLIPVLQSLPVSMQQVNITMGYPLQQSHVYSVLKLFFEVQQEMLQHQYKSVHHTIARRWLEHPLCDADRVALAKLQEKILRENLIRVPVAALASLSKVSALLFGRMMADMEAFQRLREMMELLIQLPFAKSDHMTKGLCTTVWKTLQQLEPLFSDLRPQPDLYFMGSLLMKQLGSLSVPFEGEPLQGVQLMGLLESRGLDFDELIVLGANEGSLPRIKPPDSFLPDNVRRAFGLPVPEHQDAIFAYVFYRLLHRTQQLQLVYNALVTDNSTGEVSRFVQQLEFESKIPVHHSKVSYQVAPDAWPEITVAKNDAVMRLLFLYHKPEAPKTISPSAINTYLNCRLQFFFKYLARIEAPEELEEAVEASAVGSVVHKLMELLYTECGEKYNNAISKEAVQWMQEHKERLVNEAFRLAWRRKEIKGTLEITGELHIVRAIVLQYVDLLLQVDEDYAPFTLKSLEVKLDETFTVPIEGSMKRVLLSGYVDRVDEKDGVVRMVDYKTGSDNPTFHSLEALFERDGNKQNKAAAQTLLYSWMFRQKFPAQRNFEPALIAVRHLQLNNNQVRLIHKTADEVVSYQNIHTVLDAFETQVRTVLAELFDPAVAFDQTPDASHCQYCDFAGICGRG